MNGTPDTTPGGRTLRLPKPALAEAVAEEWRAQGKKPNLSNMPLTRFCYLAIDRVAVDRDTVAGELLAYAETDLVCYRAGENPELDAVQARELDPLLAWAKDRFGVGLLVTGSPIPVRQPDNARAKLQGALTALSDWQLGGLLGAVQLLSSLVLALALLHGRLRADEAFRLAHLEETHETSRWGSDHEKEKTLARARAEIFAAERFFSLLS